MVTGVRWTNYALRCLMFLLAVPMTAKAQLDSSRIARGFSVGIPLGLSASALVMAHRPGQRGPEGPFVGGELGAFGVSAHVGRVSAGDGGATILRVGALQWWGRGQNTYVGGDFRVMVMGSFGVGAYARVVGTRGPVLLPVLMIGFGY